MGMEGTILFVRPEAVYRIAVANRSVFGYPEPREHCWCYRGSNPIQSKPYGVVLGVISVLSGFRSRDV